MNQEPLIKYCEQEGYKLAEPADNDVIPLECINCILDDILSTPEDIRGAWIQLYEKGGMGITCVLTGKRHLITKEYFEKVKWD